MVDKYWKSCLAFAHRLSNGFELPPSPAASERSDLALMLVYFNEIDVEKSTFQLDLFYYFRRTNSFAHNAFYEL